MSKGIVTTMFVCPRCAADISANSKPSKCPKCGFKFSKTGKSELSDKFEAGKSPYDQLYELVQQDMEKFLDQPANKFIPGMSKEQADQLRVSNKVRLAFFQNKRKAEMHKFFETVPNGNHYATNGVHIHYAPTCHQSWPGNASGSTFILDATLYVNPISGASRLDFPLPVGQILTGIGVNITTMSIGPEGATVKIEYPKGR